MRYFKVKNLEKYQHYHTRNPPWIKLHQVSTSDPEFVCLPDAAKAHLMLIWLLASRLDNRIPHDEHYVRTQIGARDRVDLAALDHFIELLPASKALASRKRVARRPLANRQHIERDREEESYRNPPPTPALEGGGFELPDLPSNGTAHLPPPRTPEPVSRRDEALAIDQVREYAIHIGFHPMREDMRRIRELVRSGATIAAIQEHLDKLKAGGHSIAEHRRRGHA